MAIPHYKLGNKMISEEHFKLHHPNSIILAGVVSVVKHIT